MLSGGTKWVKNALKQANKEEEEKLGGHLSFNFVHFAPYP